MEARIGLAVLTLLAPAAGGAQKLVWTEALPGGPAHELKVTLKSGAVRRVWVDAATDGVAFPRSIEVGIEGRLRRLRIVVEGVEVNPPLDARFRMPR